MTHPGDDYSAVLASNPGLHEELQRQRVLITGATGFIGGHVVEFLHRAGAEVHATTRSDEATTSFDTPVQWHRCDLGDAEQTLTAVRSAQPHQIIHMASLVKGARDPDLLLPMFAANTASTVHLLEAARTLDVSRVQLAGSLEEPERPGEPATSPYALSKAASRSYGDYYRTNTDLDVVNLQIFMVYGPAQRDENKLIPYVIRSLQAGEAPSLSSGGRKVDWVYVGDVAQGIARCCVGEAPTVPVPLGTGRLATVRDVVEQLAALAGPGPEPRFGSITDRSNEVEKVADVETTTGLLGWAPTVDLPEGLAATLQWYGGGS
jgi:nucleoside-diphosphate-sugar epimerase